MKNGKIWEAYEPPFICDDQGATVEDKNGNIIITVRGWSRLSQLFEHNEAFQLQLDIAHFVANKLNELKCDHHYAYAVNAEICTICKKVKNP